MEINRENYKKLVECCERFYRAEDDLYDLSATGRYGRDFYKFYANQREDGMDDDVQYEKFNALLEADNYSTEEKLDILMGNVPDPFENIEIFIDPNGNTGLQRITGFKEILSRKK